MISQETINFTQQRCNSDHTPDLTDTLTQWCQCNSGSHHLSGLANMAELLITEISTYSDKKSIELLEVSPLIETDGITGEANISSLGKALHVRTRPDASVQILINGHYDTVYGKDDAFQECTILEPGIMNGPAVSDMKGGLLVMLRALGILESHPAAANIGWQLLIGADEEIGSPGTAPLLEKAADECDLGLVYESSPVGGSLVRNRMGSGTFLIRAIGTAAHVGKDFTAGRNAILAISEVVTQIQALNDVHPHIRFNTGKIAGGDVLNTVPDRAYGRFNIRVSNTEDASFAKSALEKICHTVSAKLDTEIIIEGDFTRPAKNPATATTQLYQAIANCGNSIGQDLGWHDTGGGADGSNLLAHGLPNIDSMGVIGGNLHSKDEFIYLDSLYQRIQLSSVFLIGIAKGEIELAKITN